MWAVVASLEIDLLAGEAGDLVRVQNPQGACLAGVIVDYARLPGVAQPATGAWLAPLETGASGLLQVHGLPKVPIPNRTTSSMPQAPTPHSAPARVEHLADELPAIEAH